MPMHDATYVSVEGFGKRTSLSTRAVWRLVGEGIIPSLRVGRRRLIPLQAGLSALLAQDRGGARQHGRTYPDPRPAA